MSAIENASNALRSAKAKSTTAAETAHTGIRFTAEFLGYIGAAIKDLDGFSTALPSEETVDSLVNHVATARDERLDAYSILQGLAKSTNNADIERAARLAQSGLEDFSAPDPTKFQAGPSVYADADRLRTGITQLHRHIAELRALAAETSDMYQDMGGKVHQATVEGDIAITNITAFQQEVGMAE